jgi:hypothetical protein
MGTQSRWNICSSVSQIGIGTGLSDLWTINQSIDKLLITPANVTLNRVTTCLLLSLQPVRWKISWNALCKRRLADRNTQYRYWRKEHKDFGELC